LTYLKNACPKQEPLDGSNMSRSSHETIELKNVTQVYKLNLSSLTLPIIFYMSENLLKSCFNFIIMATPFISSMSNHLTLTCLGSKLLEKHLATITRHCGPFSTFKDQKFMWLTSMNNQGMLHIFYQGLIN
jgi:hypothetical protein